MTAPPAVVAEPFEAEDDATQELLDEVLACLPQMGEADLSSLVAGYKDDIASNFFAAEFVRIASQRLLHRTCGEISLQPEEEEEPWAEDSVRIAREDAEGASCLSSVSAAVLTDGWQEWD